MMNWVMIPPVGWFRLLPDSDPYTTAMQSKGGLVSRRGRLDFEAFGFRGSAVVPEDPEKYKKVVHVDVIILVEV